MEACCALLRCQLYTAAFLSILLIAIYLHIDRLPSKQL